MDFREAGVALVEKEGGILGNFRRKNVSMFIVVENEIKSSRILALIE